MTTERRKFARFQRSAATSAEAILWDRLRARRFLGLKFRRQVPLLSYTVDLLCVDLKLIIEIDGTQHALHHVYDFERTKHIESQGYRVIRFSNEQVLNDLQAVLDAISAEMQVLHHLPPHQNTPSPLPLSHTGEGFQESSNTCL